MPAFTFEKISPPVRHGPIPPIAKKQRGLIAHILDGLFAARVKTSVHEEQDAIVGNEHKPSD